MQKSKVEGVFAGVLCWFIERDVTLFIPIQSLEKWQNLGHKSVKYDVATETDLEVFPVDGVKKRVFCEYDFTSFVETMEYWRKING